MKDPRLTQHCIHMLYISLPGACLYESDQTHTLLYSESMILTLSLQYLASRFCDNYTSRK